MDSQGVVANRLLDLPGPFEQYRQLALEQAARTSDTLASITENDWCLPTVLPFWKVSDVVGHLFVVAGFFTTATPVISGRTLQWDAVRGASHLSDPVASIAIPVLHYSNIAMPRIAGRVLSRSVSVNAVRAQLDMLAVKVARIPDSRLDQDLPYFRWSVPIHLYVAVLAKELAVHRWEIENAARGSALDSGLSAILPTILWAAAPVYSRTRGDRRGAVQTVEPGRTLTWRLGSKRVFAALENDTPVDAVIAGDSAYLSLTMMGRLPPTRLGISGDVRAGQAFLRAFSYRAGPTPFFNP